MKKTYTVKDIAGLLGFSTNTVYKYLDEGKIKSTRFGKEGRFRIPEREVAKLLQESRGIERPIGDYSKTGAPGYFDWFIGFLSMGLGFSQFIFPAYSLMVQTAGFVFFLQLIHILLFMFGLALVLSDIFDIKGRNLHKIVHIVLATLLLTTAAILFYTGIVPDSIGYFVAAVIVFITVFARINGENRFLIYLNMLLALTGLGVIIFPKAFFVSTIIQVTAFNIAVFAVLWVIAEVVLISLSFRTVKYGGLYLKIISFGTAFFSLVYSTFVFTNGFWGRAVYCAILASFAVILPFAGHFESFSIKSKKEMTICFIWLLGLFFVGSIALFFIYHSFESFMLSELANRANTADDVLTTFMVGNESKVSTFAKDEGLISLMRNQKNLDVSAADTRLKQFYLVSSGTLRRVILVDKNGVIRDTYPFNLSSQNLDISNRDYFKAGKSGSDVSVTGIMQPSSPGIPPAVLITAPILDANGSFLGVLTGSADLVELTRKIKQIEFGDRGKFILADSSKNYIIPPAPDKILSKAPADSFVSKAVDGESGSGKYYNSEGFLSYAAYRQAEKYGWGLVAEEPLSDVFKTYSITGFVIFLVFLISGVGSMVLTIYLGKKK